MTSKSEAPHQRAIARYEAGDLDGALAIYDALGDTALAHKSKGVILRQLGRFEAAEAAFTRAVALAPDDDDAAYYLSMMQLWRGDFANGWAGYERRPGPAKGSPIPKIEANFKLVRSLFENFPFDNYAGSGCPDDTPIFIVGMSRSGTTLVEQILASHSQVHGAGELYDLASIGGTFLNGFRETPLALRQCDAADFARVGVDYVAAIKRHARKARFITDKMPENFLLIGLIALVLPNGSFIAGAIHETLARRSSNNHLPPETASNTPTISTIWDVITGCITA